MIIPEIETTRAYESVYTMDVAGDDGLHDIVEVSDTLIFEETDTGYVGYGQTDEPGDTMVVHLSQLEYELAGVWVEQNSSGLETARGVLSFVVDVPAEGEPYSGGLIGQWDNDAGTWCLVPKI